ncbi:DUF2804 domain-containing protein [Fusibacter bizertensis]|uniref:DUF2804 domain-containing protein n=1 Tax=Fusibacter bizertensis TaxID=1488331 RepID=A0ABT6NCX1_9FIRM|nr:DUF2804 domain-containing protein [Fusibacter bizertensis]MDH8678236.1 DUF2804 domain-containing protein [Fusibacter bizertensis]
MSQKELLPGDLLDQNGYLMQSGYSKQLIKKYNRKKIKAKRFKIKEWDYYLVYNNDFAVALTLADNSYMGMVSATIIDFKTMIEVTKSKIIPFTFGRLKMPECSYDGEASYKSSHVAIDFYHEIGARRLRLNYANFMENKPLIVDLNLYDAPEDSMVIATPFEEDKHAFYYNQKIVGIKANGSVNFDGRTYEFNPNDQMLGILDWGRGVWTYDNTWYWSSAVGEIDNHIFGFNLGYGFGDTTAATENMLFYDGKGHKIEHVKFQIPLNSEHELDYMSTWKFSSSDLRFEAIFEPIIDRSALISLGILKSDQHQVFGYFTGKAKLDDGTVINFDKFLGFAEKVRNKW